MAVTIRKAEKHKAKLRLGLIGPSGSGKTYSALLLAFGLGGKVGMIDTEHGSGELYASLGDYDVIRLDAPYTVAKYREAIKAFEAAGYDTIIIDSLSHAWAGEGGLLDKQSQLEKSGRYKNSYASWREVTPDHNRLIDEMLTAPCHIIATMRSRTEYALELNSQGKQVPRKIGMAPVQREGMEYEFTVVMQIDDSHGATATKDRTALFDGWADRISAATGAKLLEWLNSGAEPVEPSAPAPDTISIAQAQALSGLFKQHQNLTGNDELWNRAKAKWQLTDMLELKQKNYEVAFNFVKGKIAEAERAKANGGTQEREAGEEG